MSKLNIVILAAGKGTRMYSDTPKVLHSIAGKTMLQHVLDTANRLASYKNIVVYGHGGELVPKSIDQQNCAFVLQEPQLGTGHAVQQAIPNIEDDSHTLVLYGDVPLIQFDTLKRMCEYQDKLVLLTVHLTNPTGYGRIIRNEVGAVQAIIEEKDATDTQKKTTEINTGILLAPSRALKTWLVRLDNNNAQKEYYLTDIVAMAVKDGMQVETVNPAYSWEVEGVNSKLQLAALERTWQRSQAEKLMQQGVTLADPKRIDIRGELQCERDVEIDVGCLFEGKVRLGKGVKIGAYSVIRDTTIAAGTLIAPYSHIDQAEIAESCQIGPYARIRPGTKLAKEVHVGNFVEIKNSQIAEKSKANHLSYVGDATVGSKVNIGAGTITCNYDGANKFRTVIEDEAFIGSDTQLIAPVTVGKGATIGAGSTITKDTPAGELTLSRSKQVTIPGWQRPTKKK